MKAAPGKPMAEEPVLALRGATKRFGSATVLDHVDLDVTAGEVVGLIGENGAGKSTLMNIVSGNLQPDGGVIRFDAETVAWSGPREAILAGISFVHQELSGIRSLSVKENMFLGDYCARHGVIGRSEMRRRAREVLQRVGAPHIDVDADFGSLRTADQQAVEIAKSLRRGVRLLLLDEPTSSLTRHEASSLFALVRQLRAAGVGVIFVTHRLEEALDLCDRLVVLRDGRLVGNRPAREWTRDDLIEAMAGRRLEARAASASRAGARLPYLRLDGVGDGALVRNVSFDLARGEILGLFGLVGAGRTEILEMLAGARPVAGGTMTLDGHPYRPASPSAIAAHGVAYLPEGRKANGILPNRPVRENLTISVLRRLCSAGVIRRAAERRQVDEDIRALGIVAQSAEQPIRYLSGGNQQKALLARALATRPSVLLLDEPTHGVDVRTKEQIYALLRQLAGQGMAIVLVSSEMAEVMALADRILVMSNGRPVAVHERSAFDELALMRDAFRFLERTEGLVGAA